MWKLKKLADEKIIEVSTSIFRIGRNTNANIKIDDCCVSRNHANLFMAVDGRLYVVDQGSFNGTFLNGDRLNRFDDKEVKHGDIVGFGCSWKPGIDLRTFPFANLIYEVMHISENPAPQYVQPHGSVRGPPDVATDKRLKNVETAKNSPSLKTKKHKTSESSGQSTASKEIALSNQNNDFNVADTGKSVNHVAPERSLQNVQTDPSAQNVPPNGSVAEPQNVSNDKCVENVETIKSQPSVQTQKEKPSDRSKPAKALEEVPLSKQNNVPTVPSTGKKAKNVATKKIHQNPRTENKDVLDPSGSDQTGVLKVVPQTIQSKDQNIVKSSQDNRTSVNQNSRSSAEEIIKTQPLTDSKSKIDGAPKEHEYDITSDYILISDDEDDDNLFSCSQIFQLNEKIKKESFLEDVLDPYAEIKKELADMDYMDDPLLNKVPIEIDDQPMCTNDLLLELDSQVVSDEEQLAHQVVDNKKVPVKDCVPDKPEKSVSKGINNQGISSTRDVESRSLNVQKQRHTKPPIIEPHVENKKLKLIKVDLQKRNHNGVTDRDLEKKNSKRQYTENPKSSNKRFKSCNSTTSCNSKTIQEEFNKITQPENRNQKTMEDKSNHVIERKRKLKELTNKPNQKVHIEVMSKTKTVPKVKCSEGRGNFMLEENNKPKHNLRSNTKNPVLNSKVDNLIPNSNNIPNIVKEKRIPLKKPVNGIVDGEKGQKNGIIWKKVDGSKPNNNTRTNLYTKTEVDDIMNTIVTWPTKWLGEQENNIASPPVNYPITPVKMPNSFKSFSDYKNILTPLVILELWQDVYESFYREERTPFRAFVNHSRIVGQLLYLDCECYVPKEDLSNNILRTNDVALIEMMCTDSKQKYQLTSFSVITRSNRIPLDNDTLINNNVAQLCRSVPETHLTFTLMTRLNDKKLVGNKVIIRLITNISPHLKLIRTVRILEQSPLCKYVLQPNTVDYKVPVENVALNELVNKDWLNSQQKRIILEAASFYFKKHSGIYVIKGPPGTGKSTVICSIIQQILFRDPSDTHNLILIACPSNAAVDGLVLKMAEIREKLPSPVRRCIRMLRLGPEKSICPNSLKYSANVLAKKNVFDKCCVEKPHHEITDAEKDMFLKKHLGIKYNYEVRCAEDVLVTNCNLICTTLNSCLNNRLEDVLNRSKRKFTCCIVDEAAQCTEVESLLPLQLGIEKFILVGDSQQLPPTIRNGEARKLGFGKSLFSRLSNLFGDDKNSPIRMLTDQYRMSAEICHYPNRTFYKGKLRTAAVHTDILNIKPYLLYNISNADSDNQSNQYQNKDEVRFIRTLLVLLTSSINYTCKYSIGIITPYQIQKQQLQTEVESLKLNNNISIAVNTVDSFQGQENDIIIISCVRYSPNIFLQNENRLNVALTRARQGLYIIGSYTLFKHCKPFYDLREDAKRRKVCIDIKELPSNLSEKLYNDIFKNA